MPARQRWESLALAVGAGRAWRIGSPVRVTCSHGAVEAQGMLGRQRSLVRQIRGGEPLRAWSPRLPRSEERFPKRHLLL